MGGGGALKALLRELESLGVAPQYARALAKGLPMDEASRMARAREMGFDVDTPLYHSTLEDVRAFAPHGKFYGNSGISGIHLTDSPEMASRYLDRYGNRRYDGVEFQKNIAPLFIRPGNTRELSGKIYDGPQAVQGFPLPKGYQWPKSLDGVDTVIRRDSISPTGDVAHLSQEDMDLLRVLDDATDPTYKGPPISGTEYIVRDPRNIRSRFAAFAPDEKDSGDLLAGFAPVGVLEALRQYEDRR